jgi:gas vesicle protein
VRGARRAAAAGQRVETAERAQENVEVDWERVAVFGTGIALGAALGAGVALLFAPLSGEDARAAIARRSARIANQGRDVWDELRDELEWAAKRGKRRVGRRVQRARWAAEDFIDDRRRPDGWLARRRAEAKEKPRKTATDLDERDVQEIVEALC